MSIDEVMTLDKVITYVREVAKKKRETPISTVQEEIDFMKYAEEHEQLAELLEELKAYREIGTVEECKESVLDIEKAYNKGYADGSLSVTSEISNNVIDDFVKTLLLNQVVDKSVVRRVAEQFKEGGENDKRRKRKHI